MNNKRLDDKVRLSVRSEILSMAAYHVQDAGGFIKLDAMENPYSFPENLVDDWLARLRACSLNRYPDPSASSLRTAIRRCNAVPDAADILFGNGSDELIQIILMAVASPDTVVLAPKPSFVMYHQIADSLGLQFVNVDLDPNGFGLDQEAMLSAIERHRPSVVFLAYPNNPTGNLFDNDAIEAIISAAPGLVVLDEAYAPFANASFMPDLPKYDNLLVMRTVSKLGLAGLRLGFLAGPSAWIEQFDKIRLPYNINILTQVSAEFAIEHYSMFESQTRMICVERERLYSELSDVSGLTVYPTHANFVLFKLDDFDVNSVFVALKQAGVLIKNMGAAGGVLDNCLRVTVGKVEENDAFLVNLKIILSSQHPLT